MDIEKELHLFLYLLSKEDYYQAHDEMEHLWREMKKEDHKLTNFIKGLINAAVAFEHIKRATPNASIKAQKTFAGFAKYKNDCKYLTDELKAVCFAVEQKAKHMNLL